MPRSPWKTTLSLPHSSLHPAVLAYLLIFPAGLGVRGAAAATVVAQVGPDLQGA
jgi:Na+-driven multidrug efflux pump